ncbi:protease modulator HflK [Thalassoroseus pseudoceratinae]|uniref:protease modulator HflK n=1 Tax=Thalassoroseus pseudoceratinae TaxID=2713176 RepID=UPI001424422F|nr:protease modulator HflK [Thalassoroseus pseudoceratinae]
MKKWLAAIFGLGWLMTGLFLVSANEVAVVERCGQIVRNDTGQITLWPSGVYFDWPWPISQVRRVNVQQVRSLTIGAVLRTPNIGEQNVLPITQPAGDQYLTGDKNILEVQLTVQYHIAPEQVDRFLYHAVDPVRQLELLTKTAATQAFSTSGVDSVYPLGLSDLQDRLTQDVRMATRNAGIGLAVDDVTLADVSPPLAVQASFLDVVNARADRERFVQTAETAAEQRVEQAKAEASELRNLALQDRDRRLAQAEGAAARFQQIVDAVSSEDRRMTLQRLYWKTVAEVFGQLRGQVILDTGQPVDLNLLPTAKSQETDINNLP